MMSCLINRYFFMFEFLIEFGFSEKRLIFFISAVQTWLHIFQIKILKVLVHSGSLAIGCVIFSTSVQNLTSLAYVNYCLKISAIKAKLFLEAMFFVVLFTHLR